jgi:apolipoprotein D and lipocalin family protein
MYKTFLSLVFLLLIISCAESQPLKLVENVDLTKYAGRWYDIASYPARFQNGCRCTTADYELIPGKNYLEVVNRCIRFSHGKSRISMVRGKAFVIKNTGNARFKVQFFWPFRGNYYIIGLAEDYSWAVVGHPHRKYLWILSRESFMPADTYNQILTLVRNQGYDPKKLQKTPQNCDNDQ